MSEQKNSSQVNSATPNRRGSLIAIAVAILVIALVAATLMYQGDNVQPAQDGDAARAAALASEHSPMLGEANAKVHIVEFLDPACETCALFFPMVKNWMKEVPGQIRLSVRHVAFHKGSDYAVKVRFTKGLITRSRSSRLVANRTSTGRPWRRCLQRKVNGHSTIPFCPKESALP
jgi:protein-disulfide isomerase